MCSDIKKKSKLIYEVLDDIIKTPVSELNYSNEFELLIAVMLSAQCTDKRVNIITERLFSDFKKPEDYINITTSELEEYIKSCNYYHNKAKNIIETCKVLVNNYQGIVPNTHEELVKLPGVGNKTANVVQAVAFGQQALPVDTHILRVSNRLGLVDTKSPDKCEKSLKEIFCGYDFGKLHHLLLLFGRYHCTARCPRCDECKLKDVCKTYKDKE